MLRYKLLKLPSKLHRVMRKFKEKFLVAREILLCAPSAFGAWLILDRRNIVPDLAIEVKKHCCYQRPTIVKFHCTVCSLSALRKNKLRLTDVHLSPYVKLTAWNTRTKTYICTTMDNMCLILLCCQWQTAIDNGRQHDKVLSHLTRRRATPYGARIPRAPRRVKEPLRH